MQPTSPASLPQEGCEEDEEAACRRTPDIFVSLEDETGISNAIIRPEVYERNLKAVTGGKFLLIEGVLQSQDDVVSVKASSVRVLDLGPMDMRSHDFH